MRGVLVKVASRYVMVLTFAHLAQPREKRLRLVGAGAVNAERFREQGHSTSVLFSGDLGSAGRVLLRSPSKPPHAENVVMETTYGDRVHKQLGPSIDEFYGAVNETFKRGGNVIIPCGQNIKTLGSVGSYPIPA